MDIVPIRAFSDNYIWMLQSGTRVAVVDPGDEAPVLDHLGCHGLTLCAVLLTHHHADHVGGVEALVQCHRVPVYGPVNEHIASVSVPLRGGDRVSLEPLGANFEVLDVAGHTRGHIAYYGANALFCGDTLFACGCGRLFEGTAAQMFQSLGMLAALPPDTRVYCAHEYTQTNIRFALAVEPDNAVLQARARDVAALRERGLPTLPSTIAAELATNPFLRAGAPAVRAAAQRYRGAPISDELGVFTAIREWKNVF
jgi:hydroxyacylglutathione hydrolase